MNKFYSMSWIINSQCNLKCIHCYPNSGFFANKDKLSCEELNIVSKNLKSISFEKIYISGGEPLMCENIEYYLKIAHNHSNKLYICTNSTILDEDKLLLLMKYNVKITISIQHIDREKAFLIYGNNIYNKIIRRIKFLRSNNIKVKIEVTVMRHNYQELDKIIRFALENGINEIDFKRFRPVGRGKNNSSNIELTPEENRQVLCDIFGFTQKYTNLEISTDDPLYGVNVFSYLKKHGYDDDESMRFLEKNRIYGCKAGKRWIGINYDGKVSICPLLIYCDITIGNILEDSLENILNNSNLINDIKKTECVLCKFSEICGGCRACAVSCNGNLMSIDPMCTFN